MLSRTFAAVTAVLLIVGSHTFAKSVEIPSEFKICRQDTDCTVQRTECCGCPNVAINKQRVSDYQSMLQKDCGARACNMYCPSLGPASRVSCENGICIYREK